MKTSARALRLGASILAMALARGAFAQDAPELITPSYGQHFVARTNTHFAWQPKPGYSHWVLQVADNPALGHPLIEVPVTTPSTLLSGMLPASTHLYWRVFYINQEGQASWSGTGHFWTAQAQQRVEFLN
jgi:hypothetical protein